MHLDFVFDLSRCKNQKADGLGWPCQLWEEYHACNACSLGSC